MHTSLEIFQTLLKRIMMIITDMLISLLLSISNIYYFYKEKSIGSVIGIDLKSTTCLAELSNELPEYWI